VRGEPCTAAVQGAATSTAVHSETLDVTIPVPFHDSGGDGSAVRFWRVEARLWRIAECPARIRTRGQVLREVRQPLRPLRPGCAQITLHTQAPVTGDDEGWRVCGVADLSLQRSPAEAA